MPFYPRNFSFLPAQGMAHLSIFLGLHELILGSVGGCPSLGHQVWLAGRTEWEWAHCLCSAAIREGPQSRNPASPVGMAALTLKPSGFHLVNTYVQGENLAIAASLCLSKWGRFLENMISINGRLKMLCRYFPHPNACCHYL